MIDEELLVQLRAQHASSLRDKTAALIDLSALVFNRPLAPRTPLFQPFLVG